MKKEIFKYQDNQISNISHRLKFLFNNLVPSCFDIERQYHFSLFNKHVSI